MNKRPLGMVLLELDYLEAINTIGYDGKSLNGSSYDANDAMAYYIKYDESTLFHLVFNDFEGASTGNTAFILRMFQKY